MCWKGKKDKNWHRSAQEIREGYLGSHLEAIPYMVVEKLGGVELMEGAAGFVAQHFAMELVDIEGHGVKQRLG